MTSYVRSSLTPSVAVTELLDAEVGTQVLAAMAGSGVAHARGILVPNWCQRLRTCRSKGQQMEPGRAGLKRPSSPRAIATGVLDLRSVGRPRDAPTPIVL